MTFRIFQEFLCCQSSDGLTAAVSLLCFTSQWMLCPAASLSVPAPRVTAGDWEADLQPRTLYNTGPGDSSGLFSHHAVLSLGTSAQHAPSPSLAVNFVHVSATAKTSFDVSSLPASLSLWFSDYMMFIAKLENSDLCDRANSDQLSTLPSNPFTWENGKFICPGVPKANGTCERCKGRNAQRRPLPETGGSQGRQGAAAVLCGLFLRTDRRRTRSADAACLRVAGRFSPQVDVVQSDQHQVG